MSLQWHYLENGVARGPVPIDGLRELIEAGTLRRSDQVWNESMSGWTVIQAVPELSEVRKKKSGNQTVWIIVGFALAGLLIIAGAGFFALSSSTSKQEMVVVECSPDFQSFVLGRAPGLAKMARITFPKIDEKKEIEVTIEFPSPVSRMQSELATRIIAQAVLDKLIIDGHSPAKERTSVSVVAMGQVIGATGTTKFVGLGGATYSPDSDQIVFVE